jgi:L-threonylcarbamoyladenylate synthase
VTRVVAVDEPRAGSDRLDEAGAVLRRGGLVAFPTESFYGLGADALDEAAVARVFQAKGRPETKPVLVLVESVDMAAGLVADLSDDVRGLMARHWPGPLTLVLRARSHVPLALTAGTGTVGVRMPGHRIAVALVRAAGRPITAPSANPSGAAPPTTAAEVRAYFPGVLDLILDGGTTAGGTGSTVADCTVWPPRLLRAGPIELP